MDNNKSNIVFIAKSLDGFISDKNGELDWLQSIPNPENIDMGYSDFMENIDAIVMGRVTFETVCNFDIDWPYTKPVFVLSNTMKSVNTKYQDKIELINGNLKNIINDLNHRGYNRIYIDGGRTIQSFLREDLIDELIITTIPVLLGGGSPLFSNIPMSINLEHVKTKVFLNQIVQSHYLRRK